MKKVILSFLCFALVAPIVFAQSANKLGDVYQLPFSAENNRIEQAISNVGEEAMANVTVLATEIPEWIDLLDSAVAINTIESQTEAVATFDFDVDREAPIGESKRTREWIINNRFNGKPQPVNKRQRATYK